MTKIIGRAEAKKFGDAHEEYEGNPRCEKEMDLFNNKAGRKAGGQRGNCESNCSNAPLQNAPRGSCKTCGDYDYYGYYYDSYYY